MRIFKKSGDGDSATDEAEAMSLKAPDSSGVLARAAEAARKEERAREVAAEAARREKRNAQARERRRANSCCGCGC